MIAIIIALGIITIFALLKWFKYYIITIGLYGYLFDKYNITPSAEQIREVINKITKEKDFIQDFQNRFFLVLKIIIILGIFILMMYSYSCFIEQIG